MKRRALTRAAIVVLATAVTTAAIPGEAAPPTLIVDGAATGGAPAVNLSQPGDLVSVYNFGPVRDDVANGAIAAAVDAGGWGVFARGFGIGLVRVSRNGVPIHDAPGPYGFWSYPMSVTALPLDSIGAILGRNVSRFIASGTVVVSETSAGITGAQAGDIMDLIAGDGSIVQVIIGRVAPDSEVGGAEIVMSTAQADLLDAKLSTSVLIYGQFDRARLDAGFAARGLSSDPKVRIRHSWDPLDPDSTIGVAKTKKLLGELAYHVYADDSLSVDDGWRTAFIPPTREAYPTGIVAQCNKTIKKDIAAALQEVVDSGLTSLIDVANTNTYGGCFGPRFTRIVGSQLGALSRHTWGQALDTNTLSNCQGCVPKMDCRIVRIFRKHNFAWGGNFINPDGMHFEWVGEPRNTYQYPSRYCPNVPSGGIESFDPGGGSAAPAPTARDTILIDEGSALGQ